MKKIESLKDRIENQTIRSLNIIETENNNVLIFDIELMNGDKIEFQNNEGNVCIDLRSARDIEIERITEELNKMKSGETRTFHLKVIDPDFLRKLASQKANELGHSNPLNVVTMDGSNCVVNLTDNSF